MRRRIGLLVTLTALATMAAVSAPAFPQEGEATERDTTAAPEGENTVDRILREQEQLLQGRPFAYKPSGRRDPFAALITETRKNQRERLPGVRGMSVDEIDISGIVKDPDNGDMALVIGSDNKGYFLRAGDQVYDGTVISVDSNQGLITFRQRIDDPRRIKPFRDVVKRLVPVDEERGG